MKYTLLITQGPPTSWAHDSAYKFSQALIEQKQELLAVFFFQDGLNCAVQSKSNETVTKRWQAFSKEHAIPLLYCKGSAMTRGLADDQTDKFADMFKRSSLVELIELTSHSDRTVHFG